MTDNEYGAVKIEATNDANGNPRRGWYVHREDTKQLIDFVKEGYAGDRALTDRYPNALVICTVKVTPAEYRNAVRYGNGTDRFTEGMRVETHPATDEWMSGDRFGTVVKVATKYIHVKMDRSGRTLKFTLHNILPR